MKSDVIEIPCYSLSPRVLTLYNSLEGNFVTSRQRETWENLNDNKNKYNELSSHSAKRLRKAISYMIYTTTEKQIFGKVIQAKTQEFTTEYEKTQKYSKPVNYKLSMITLTLPSPQVHSDETIKSKCLHQFLIEISKKFSCTEYIWKAEKQENNNIHFHILINKYLHHEKIREIWNRITGKLGYIEAYQKRQIKFFADGFRMADNKKDFRTYEIQLKAFEKGKLENWLNPNSTDIHALYKLRNAGAYLTKYLVKGVTKNSRILEINNIRRNNLRIGASISEINNRVFFGNLSQPEKDNFNSQLDYFQNQFDENETRLAELLKMGVSGKIWGQSQSLSKLTNFRDVCSWEAIPEIEEVTRQAEKKLELKVGSRTVYSYIFDVTKFPELNSQLKNHISLSH